MRSTRSPSIARLRRRPPRTTEGSSASAERRCSARAPSSSSARRRRDRRARGRSRAPGRAAPTPRRMPRSPHELRASPKERAENVMIVDLMRNDLSRVCEVRRRSGRRAARGGDLPGTCISSSALWPGTLRRATTVGELLDARLPRGQHDGRAEALGDDDPARRSRRGRAGSTPAASGGSASTARSISPWSSARSSCTPAAPSSARAAASPGRRPAEEVREVGSRRAAPLARARRRAACRAGEPRRFR